MSQSRLKIRLSDLAWTPCEEYLKPILERYGRDNYFDPIALIYEINEDDYDYIADDLFMLDDMCCEIYDPSEIIGDEFAKILTRTTDKDRYGSILMFYSETQTHENFLHFISIENDIERQSLVFSECRMLHNKYWNEHFLTNILRNSTYVDIILRNTNAYYKEAWFEKLLKSQPQARQFLELFLYDEDYQTKEMFERIMVMNPSVFQLGKMVYMAKGVNAQEILKTFLERGGTQKLLDHIFNRLHYRIANLKINRIFID
ncbi:MAG: hypothetical protein C0594_01260 [Marinilabiliales bacterium]|nr:MAG: hypothetical protein C0594_01260 [Marinilabiliales bacterium]